MGKFRNHEKASFWSADTDEGKENSMPHGARRLNVADIFEERSDLVKSARGGGSITPRFAKILQQHVCSGKLTIHTHTTVQHQKYSPLDQTYTITTTPLIADMPKIHFVYFATGVQSEYEKLNYLQGLLAKHPIESIDGLPALTDDLMWSPDVPLFM